jgi:G patch domain-containing protein 1
LIEVLKLKLVNSLAPSLVKHITAPSTMAGKRSRGTFEADHQESPYVFYGTPLPPLDVHTRDDGSFVPVWKQEVTDDRGRKRLHGAFTGGFSAG